MNNYTPIEVIDHWPETHFIVIENSKLITYRYMITCIEIANALRTDPEMYEVDEFDFYCDLTWRQQWTVFEYLIDHQIKQVPRPNTILQP